jgi:hypothetical protein
LSVQLELLQKKAPFRAGCSQGSDPDRRPEFLNSSANLILESMIETKASTIVV